MAHYPRSRRYIPNESYINHDPVDAGVIKDGKVYLAVFNGKSFELKPADPIDDEGEFHGNRGLLTLQDFITGILHAPVHQSMAYDDINGATYAWDDGTHWHFAHCSPKEQIDLAAEIRTFTVNQFLLAISRAQNKAIGATNDVTRATRIQIADDIQGFADDAGDEAYVHVVGSKLGQFHRDPQHDHKRIIAKLAINNVLAKMKLKALDNAEIAKARRNVVGIAQDIVSVLSTTHTMPTFQQARAKEAAAKAAAKKAAEAAPGNGHDNHNEDE